VPPGTNTGQRPLIVEPHPNGLFAYSTISALSSGTGYVTRLTLNEATGRLTDNGDFSAGTNPRDARIDPTGRFLYVTNQTSNDISVFQIDPATGGLSNEARFPTGLEPWSIAFQTIFE
jgi:6-phosphogluconolactonase